jgi:hypothetical protein
MTHVIRPNAGAALRRVAGSPGTVYGMASVFRKTKIFGLSFSLDPPWPALSPAFPPADLRGE